LSSFSDAEKHALVSGIIRRHSTNPEDVRDAALEGLDLTFARRVLDLGCGFGFMAEAVAGRCAPDAEITGVEACEGNERSFLGRVAAAGRRGRFLPRRIGERLDWPDRTFDLVVASYSLYFFPRIIPEIARVLATHGLFLAITHTEESCRDLLRAAGLPAFDARLLGSIREFSAENGGSLLAPWFAEVERLDYRNALVFEPEELDDFRSYLDFKLRLIQPGPPPGGGPTRPGDGSAPPGAAGREGAVFSKDDAIFRCREPRRA
jgi:SAM-dependent methyltransferase